MRRCPSPPARLAARSAVVLLCCLAAWSSRARAQTPTPAITCGAGELKQSIELTTSADDGNLAALQSNTYPPTSCQSTSTSTTAAGAAQYISGAQYYQNISMFRFDTSVVPVGATVTSAQLRLYMTATHADADSRNLTFRYYDSSNWPIDCGDWAMDATGTVANTTAISTISTSAYNSLALSNLGSINLAGYTGFRVWVDGGLVTGNNYQTWNHADNASNHPILELCYTLPATATPTTLPTDTPTAAATAPPTDTPTITQTPTITPTPFPTSQVVASFAVPTPTGGAGTATFHNFTRVGNYLVGASYQQRSVIWTWSFALVPTTTVLMPSDGLHGYATASVVVGSEVYIVFNGGSSLNVGKFDPATQTYTDVIASDTTDGCTGNGTITSDGTNLFIGCTGTGFLAKFMKYSTAGARLSGITFSDYKVPIGSDYDGTYLWLTLSLGPSNYSGLARITPSSMAASVGSFGAAESPSDDLAATHPNYVFVGAENNLGQVLRITKAGFPTMTVSTIDCGVGLVPSYGVYFHGGKIISTWGGTTGGVISYIDPDAQTCQSYILSNPNAIWTNEMAFNDGPDQFITTWATPGTVNKILAGSSGGGAELPTSTPTFTPTLTRTPTATAVPTPTPTISTVWRNQPPYLAPASTGTPTATGTATITPTQTGTPTSTATRTSTATPTVTRTPTFTATVLVSPTITQTPTPTVSTVWLQQAPFLAPSPTQTFTNTPTVTGTPTLTPTLAPTTTGTPNATDTPTVTPTPTGGTCVCDRRTGLTANNCTAGYGPVCGPGGATCACISFTPTPTATPTATPTLTPTWTPTGTPTLAIGCVRVPITASADDGVAWKHGGHYPPDTQTGSWTDGNVNQTVKNFQKNRYESDVSVYRFDTRAFAGSTVLSATFMGVLSEFHRDDALFLVGEVMPDGPITANDYAAEVNSTAFSVTSVDLSAWTPAFSIPVKTAAINTTGAYTKFRVGFRIVGSRPTGRNEWDPYSFDADNPPSLIICTQSPTGPTPTAHCCGDCNGDGIVTQDEVNQIGYRIVGQPYNCLAGDPAMDCTAPWGVVDVNDLVAAIDILNAGGVCP